MSEPRRPEETDEQLFFEREGQEAESLDIDPSEDVFEIVAHEDLESAAQWVPATADDAAPASIYPPRVVASEPKHTARVITAIGALLLLMAAAWWYTSAGGDVERPSAPATAPAPLIPPTTNGVAAAPAAPSPALPGASAAGPTPAVPARAADVAPAAPAATRIDSTTAAARTALPAPAPIDRNAEAAVAPPASVRPVAEPTPVSPPTPRVEEPAAPPTPAIAATAEEPPPVRTVEEPPIVIAPPTPAALVPPPPPAVAAPRPTAPVITDRDALRSVLDRYRAAYGSLNAAAAHQVYPKVDSRALERAFSQLEMQEIDFASCDIDVTGDRASAGCTGVARFVPKVGNKTPRVESRFWTFDFRRAGRDWRIENVQFR